MARVLIIGATSAIATEVARRYAARGDRLFLIARNPDKLQGLARELGGSCVGSSSADLNDTDRNAQRVEQAITTLGGLDIVVIAHGLLGDQRRTEHDWSEAKLVLETNLLSVVSLVMPIANRLEAQGHGSLAVMSSVAGERGRPRNYTYGAAKGALTLYLQGVRSRLWTRGVRVHTLKLGPVDTPMTKSHDKNVLFATASNVAEGIVAHIDAAEGSTYLPWFWGPIMGIVRRLPEPIFQKLGFLSGR